MCVFTLHHEVLFVRIVGVSPLLYISKRGSFQMKIPFPVVTLKHKELTAKPVPKFFRLGLQTGWEQEHPPSESQQRKGKCCNVAQKSLGTKLYNLERAELCCLKGDNLKRKSISASSKIQDGAILAPCSQPGASQCRKPWPSASTGVMRGKPAAWPRCAPSPSPEQGSLLATRFLIHQLVWDLLHPASAVCGD